MNANEPEIIEAEVVQRDSHPDAVQDTLPQAEVTWTANAHPSWHTPGDHARPQGDRGGMLGGFLVLAVGFVVTVLVLLFSVCIVIPFSILMRLLGVHKRR